MLNYFLCAFFLLCSYKGESANCSISCQSRYNLDSYSLSLSVRDFSISYNDSIQTFKVDKIETEINGIKLYVQNQDFPGAIFFFIHTPVKQIQKNIVNHVVEIEQNMKMTCEDSTSLVYLCLLLEGDLIAVNSAKVGDSLLRNKHFSKFQGLIVKYNHNADLLKKKTKRLLQEKSDQLAASILDGFIKNPKAIFVINPDALMQFIKNVELISCLNPKVLDKFDEFVISAVHYVPAYVAVYHHNLMSMLDRIDERRYFTFLKQVNGSIWLLKTCGGRFLSLVEQSTTGQVLNRLNASSLVCMPSYLRSENLLKASVFLACNRWVKKVKLERCVRTLEEVTDDKMLVKTEEDFSYYGRYGMSGLILKNWLQLMSK